MNSPKFIGISKRQCGQYRIAIGKELVKRALGGVRFESNCLGGRTLKVGRYRVGLAPTANGKTGPSKHADFRIAR